MILNTSLGSNSNNISLIAAAIGYNNSSNSHNNNNIGQERLTSGSNQNNFQIHNLSQYNTNSIQQYDRNHDSNNSDMVVQVLEYSD